MLPSVNRNYVDTCNLLVSHQKNANQRPIILGALSEVISSPSTLARLSESTQQTPPRSEMKFLTHVEHGTMQTDFHTPKPDYNQVSEPEPDYDNESEDEFSTAASGYVKSDSSQNRPILDVEKIDVMTLELMIKTGVELNQLVNNFHQTDYIDKHGLRNEGVCVQLTLLWMDENTSQTGYYRYIESSTGVAKVRNLIKEEKGGFDFLVKQGYTFSKHTDIPEEPGKYLIALNSDNHVAGMEVLHSGVVRFFDSNSVELAFNNADEFTEFLPLYLIAANYQSEIDGKNVTFYKFTKP